MRSRHEFKDLDGWLVDTLRFLGISSGLPEALAFLQCSPGRQERLPTAQSAPGDTPVPGEGASSLAPLRGDGSPKSVSTEKANCNV